VQRNGANRGPFTATWAGCLIQMSKDSRIVIRLETEVDQWLGDTAAKLGLDKAAYVRMLIYQHKNGARVTAGLQGHMPMRQVEATTQPSPERPPVLDVGYEPLPPPAYEPPAQPVDLDAMMAEVMATAEVESPPEQVAPAPLNGGVRRITPRQPPPFSGALPDFVR
jgi:hypothetical protein